MIITMEAGDYRRAAVMLAAHSQSDVEKINAIIEEANTLGRQTHLMFGILQHFGAMLPLIYTPTGQEWINQTILALAREEA